MACGLLDRTYLLSLLLVSCISNAGVAGVDLTIQPEAAGTDVALASVARIEDSGIFQADSRLLRRVAFAETADGVALDTYREGYNGGMWQVDEDIFNQTQNVVANPELSQLYQQIADVLLLDWLSVSWVDLRRPLYSALAARLYFVIVPEAIPMAGDVQGQAEYWKRNYNSDPSDSVQQFVDSVNELESAECPARGLDMAFVLDSSNSVGRLNFSLTLEFVANISQAFTTGPQDTQVSVVSFNRFPNISFFFDTYSNISSLIGGIQQVPYLDTPRSGLTTYTAAALNILNLDVFTIEGGARGASFAIPRIAIIVTDGRSNVNSSQTIPMAQALHEAGVTVFAVGVGKRAQTNRSRREFNGIASRPSFVSLLSEFNIMEFQSLQNNLRFEACSASAPVDIAQSVMDTLDNREVSFFAYLLPSQGMTIHLEVLQGTLVLYASEKIRNPSGALYDYRLETSTSADVYIDPDQRILEGEPLLKRQFMSASIGTIYVTIEGLGSDRNSFQLDTTFGNTQSSQSRTHSAAAVMLILALLALLT